MGSAGVKGWMAAALAVALGAAGCGGGDGDGRPACVAGVACVPAGTPAPCTVYATTCASPDAAAACVQQGTAADGTSCGSGLVCEAGACVVDCPPSTLTVEWDAFTAGDGTPLGCAAAGVAFVDVYLDGASVARWPCTDGGALVTDVAAGTYLVTVEGVDAGDRIAFRDEQSVTSTGCGGRFLLAEPAEGWVALEYAFTPTNVCFADPSYLWFSVYDEVAQATTAAVDDASTVAEKRLYQCSLDVVFPLPSGPHTLDWMQEMEETSLGVFAVRAARCSPTAFDVPRGASVGVPVVMADASVRCVP